MRNFKYIHIVTLSVIILISCTSKKTETVQDIDETSISTNEALTSVEDDRDYIVKVGDMAPDFEMSLPNGEKVILSSLRGKVVMLQFTASWCGVCRKEMPYIENDIWLKHQNNPNFALYGIDREEPVEKIEELIEKTGVTYPIGLDPDAGIFTLFAKEKAGITRNVIIDKEGKIVMLTRLFDEQEFKEMVQLIDNLLDDH
jgi:peroxiredoxin